MTHPAGMIPFYAHGRAMEAQRLDAQKRASLDLRDSERRLYSLPNAIDALLNERTQSGSFESEISQALIAGGQRTTHPNSLLVPFWALRDMTASGASGSQYLISTEVDSLAELMRGRSVVATMPITSLPNLTGNITIPRETAGPTAYVLTDENTQITEGQPTVGQVALTPRNVAALTELSRTFATQTGEGGSRYVRNTLLKSVAMKMDSLCINGSGAAGEPLGLISQISGTVSGTSLDEADVREYQTDLGDNLGPDCGFITTRTVASLLNGRQRFTGSDRTLWEGSVYAGEMGGFPAYSTPSCPVSHLLFGAWASVVLAEWGQALEVTLNPYHGFTTGGVAVRVIATFDVGLVRPAAFTVATAVT